MIKKHLTLVGVFILAFGLAFVLAWALFSPSPQPATEQPPPAQTRVLAEAELREFLQTVADGDFAAINKTGVELFGEGAVIPDSRSLFAEYATNSFPPNLVYVFLSRADQDKTYRVLLTTDENDRVVSFMAEEMAIAR